MQRFFVGCGIPATCLPTAASGRLSTRKLGKRIIFGKRKVRMASSPSPVPPPASSSFMRAPQIRLLVADETPMGCQLLKRALNRSRFGFEVVACATRRADLIHLLSTCSVNVAVIMESLEEGLFAGFEVLNELHTSFPNVRVIMLLKSVTKDSVVDAFRAGADGIFGKTEPLETLCKCIWAVHNGQIWANTEQLRFVLEALVSTSPLRIRNTKGEHLLTRKEDEIGLLVAEGMTNREIAMKLGIAEHTVSNYLFRIYEKLGISTRVELALYVIHQKPR
jgi:DNA-binding NarL/FixJ family response regulator